MKPILSLKIISVIAALVFLTGSDVSANAQLQKILEIWRVKLNATALQMSIYDTRLGAISDLTSGYVSSGNTTPTSINTLFQIGSVTKSFTAAITLQLIDEDKFSIDDTIETLVRKYGAWLPSKAQKLWNDVTVKQMLNMTSGIYSYTESSDFNKAVAKDPLHQWTPYELISLASIHKSYFAPGMGWHYSDTNYIILGLLIEKVTGHSLQHEMEQRLLSSNGLKNTYYQIAPYNRQFELKMARGYAGIKDVTHYSMTAAGAAGAMVSTAHDQAMWVNKLFNGNILTKHTHQYLLESVSVITGKPTTTNREQAYALGVSRMYASERGGLNWWYLGGTYGYLSFYCWIPSKAIIISITANIGNNPDDVSQLDPSSKYMIRDLPNAIYQLLFGATHNTNPDS